MSQRKKRTKRNKSTAMGADRQRTLQLTEVVRQNLFAFVVHEGMKAFDELLEQQRTALCGPAYTKGRPEDPVRWGYEEGRLVMGGQRVVARRPRVRQQGAEVTLPAWAEFSAEDPLDERTLEQLVLGVSTRGYERSFDTLPDELGSHGTSKSAASRRFVGATQKKLKQWLHRDLGELSIVAIMVDGLTVKEHTVIVALGVDETGKKHVLGVWLGATENHTVCGALLDDLLLRNLCPHHAYLFVIDGSKALRKAILDRFGKHALIQRCQEHKRRNVIGHLPKPLHSKVNRSMREAYRANNKATAKRLLTQLANFLDEDHPDAAASLREGLDETLTLKGMGLSQSLERTLSTTNPIENLNGSIRRVTKRVKRWRNGQMVKRWVCASILEAERGFRRLRGYKSIPALVDVLRRLAEQTNRIDQRKQAA